MSEPTPPTLVPGANARPVDVSERVTLLDVLRGFALCGVFVSNSFTWFSGRILLPRDQARALVAPPLDAVVSALYTPLPKGEGIWPRRCACPRGTPSRTWLKGIRRARAG